MKPPLCIVILLLTLAQINATAGLECRCMKRFINLASQEFKGDKDSWLDEEDDALMETFGLNARARPGDWPGCEASKCNIEPGNEIWKLRLEQLRQSRNLPGEDQLKPACIEVNSTMFLKPIQELSCGFDYEQLQRSIDNSSRSQDRNCTSSDNICLVRPFDPTKDEAAVKPVVPSSLECRCMMRYSNYASKEFISDQAKWAEEKRTAYREAYGRDIFPGWSTEALMKHFAADWPECGNWRCKMEPGSEFWNRSKKQFEEYFQARVPTNAEPACLRLHLKERAFEPGSGKFIETEQFVCGFKFRRLEALIDAPGGSRNGDDGNCTAEQPGRMTACIVRPFDSQKDASAATETNNPATGTASSNETQKDGNGAAATSPVIAMVSVIQLLMLIANKLQIAATGPD